MKTDKKSKAKNKFDWAAALFVLMMIIMTAVGLLAKYTVIEEDYDKLSGSAGWLLFGSLLVGGVLLYIVVAWIFRKVEITSNIHKKNDITQTAVFNAGGAYNKRILLFTVIFMVCWIPYLIIRFPGNIDPDTTWQMIQYFGICPRSDHHPWFDTTVFGSFWSMGLKMGSVGYGLFAYALIQSLLTAFSFGMTICYMEYNAVPKTVRVFCIVFLAAYPVIPLFAQVMMKDSIFGWIWVLFFLGFVELVRTGGDILKRRWFFFSFLVIICLLELTKKTGMYISLISLFCFLCLVKKNRARVLILGAIPCVIVSGIWGHVILPIAGIGKGSKAELLSIPCQQTACYLKYHAGDLTKEDGIILSRIFNEVSTMAEDYNPTRADAEKGRIKSGISKDALLDYGKWWTSKLMEDPLLFITAAAANSYALVYPDTVNQGDESLVFFRDNIPSREVGDSGREQMLSDWSSGMATSDEVHELLKTMYRIPESASMSDKFNAGYLWLMGCLPLLFCKTLFATWLPLFALCFLLRGKNWTGILSMVPLMVSWLTQFAGPIVLPRYMVGFVYAVPIVLTLLWMGKSGSMKEERTAAAASAAKND